MHEQRQQSAGPWRHLLAVTVLAVLVSACGARVPLPGADEAVGEPSAAGEAAAGEASGGSPDTAGAGQHESAEGTSSAVSAAGEVRQGASPPPEPGEVNELSARTDQGAQTTQAQDPLDPTEVVIPAIGVRSELVRLGLNADRSMEVPDNFDLAGWYVHSPQPGELGPAVIAGHVDSRSGPAVFYRLSELEPGDEVHVQRADGSTVTYVIDRVEQHPKDAFPTDEVYGDTEQPELRLITCGGDFDRRARSHRDNIIAFATLASS